jgi:hypothetical protein
MVGANANTGTRIYPDSNRAGPYVQQSVCAHCINFYTRVLVEGATSKAGEEANPPESLLV